MTASVVGQLSAALRRGVIAGWRLACPACGGTEVWWMECTPGGSVQWDGLRLACACGWVSPSASAVDLVRTRRDDGAGRF